ncbi:hypothetical protein [Streptomyces buecherae]|uniref:hypothetical protein n=1 Tax=Streptomyces buecherae TaxID=2763006 RepID=UPI001E3D85B2|nr:hypothetical protein [Streptomyces buecherae]
MPPRVEPGADRVVGGGHRRVPGVPPGQGRVRLAVGGLDAHRDPRARFDRAPGRDAHLDQPVAVLADQTVVRGEHRPRQAGAGLPEVVEEDLGGLGEEAWQLRGAHVPADADHLLLGHVAFGDGVRGGAVAGQHVARVGDGRPAGGVLGPALTPVGVQQPRRARVVGVQHLGDAGQRHARRAQQRDAAGPLHLVGPVAAEPGARVDVRG